MSDVRIEFYLSVGSIKSDVNREKELREGQTVTQSNDSFHCDGACGGLNGNGPYRLICLKACSQLVKLLGKDYGWGLLQQVCSWEWAQRFQKTHTIISQVSLLRAQRSDASSQLLLRGLPACLLPWSPFSETVSPKLTLYSTSCVGHGALPQHLKST